MKSAIKILIIILILSVNVEAQGYRDPNVAIYEAMRPMLEGNNYVPPQRIIIQHESVAPSYYVPPRQYNPEALRQAEQNLKEALDKVNKPIEYDFEK
jgi:hypothetical protein